MESIEVKSKFVVAGDVGGGTDGTDVVVASGDVLGTGSDVSSGTAERIECVGVVVGDVEAFIGNEVTKSDFVGTGPVVSSEL